MAKQNPLLQPIIINYQLNPEMRQEYLKIEKMEGAVAAQEKMVKRIGEIVARYYAIDVETNILRDSEIEAIKNYFAGKKDITIRDILLCTQHLAKRPDAQARGASRKLAALTRHELCRLIDSILDTELLDACGEES